MDVIQWKAFCQNGDEFPCFIKAANFLTNQINISYTAQKYFSLLQCIYNHKTLN